MTLMTAGFSEAARNADRVQDALIKLLWLERAKQRALQAPAASGDGVRPLFTGVDVGAGQAETVAYVCEFSNGRCRIVAMGAWRGEDTRGQVPAFLGQFGDPCS
jgi:hypothetical protein